MWVGVGVGDHVLVGANSRSSIAGFDLLEYDDAGLFLHRSTWWVEPGVIEDGIVTADGQIFLAGSTEAGPHAFVARLQQPCG